MGAFVNTTNYNLRIDKNLKKEAFAVFESYGLTPSQAIRLFLNQVADTNSVPLSFSYLAQTSSNTIPEPKKIKEIKSNSKLLKDGEPT